MWNSPQDELPLPLWKGYAFWVSLVLFSIITVANLLTVRARLQTLPEGQNLAMNRVELSARALYGDLLPFDPRLTARRWQELIDQLAKPDSPIDSLARAIILLHEHRDAFGEPSASQRLQSLLQRMQRAAPADPQAANILVWCQAVYADDRPLHPQQQATFRRTIDGAQLGWFRLLALKHLAQRVGDEASAQRWQQRARAEANQLQQASVVLFGVVALLLLSGVAAWVVYIFWRSSLATKRHLSATLLTPPEAHYVMWGMAAYLAMVLLGAMVGSLLRPGMRIDSPDTMAVIAIIQAFTGGTALWILHRLLKQRSLSWAQVGFSWKRPLLSFAWGTGAYVATIPVLLIVLALAQRLLPNLPTPAHPVALVASSRNPLWVTLLLLVMAAVLAPLFEEVFFRGILLNALWAVTGKRWLAILVSALVFSVLHPQIYLGWIAVFTIGVMLGTLYVESRSLLACIWMHALNNAVALIGVSLLRL